MTYITDMEYANLVSAKNKLALLERKCGTSKVRRSAMAQQLAHARAVVDLLEKNYLKKC